MCKNSDRVRLAQQAFGHRTVNTLMSDELHARAQAHRLFKVTANRPYPPLKTLFIPGMNFYAAVLGIWGTSKIVITLLGQKEDRLKTIIGPSK